jgi:HEAT repeat protein
MRTSQSMSLSTSLLLKQLENEDTEARLLAIKRLGMIYDDETIIDPLLKLLLDSDARVREAAILSLSVQSSTSKIIKPIINTLNDEEIKVQLAAIRALSEFRSIIATKPLIKILSDPEDEVRAAAVLALGLIEDKNALFPLIDCLEDQNSQVRINALVALSQLGDPRAIDPIIEMINTEADEIVQQMAILALGPLGEGDKRIIPPLVDRLHSESSQIRQYAVVSLGRTKQPEIIEPLLKIINDEDPYVRRACASALSDIKDPATVKEFIERLKDSSAEIRETAANALGKLGDPIAVPYLIETLSDEAELVREEAASALGELQHQLATKPLINLLKHEEKESIKVAAAVAIGKIEGNSPPATNFLISNLALLPLKKFLSSENLSIRAVVAEALAKIHINNRKYGKAEKYYQKASEESLTWEFKQPFYAASAIGCSIMNELNKKNYHNMSQRFEEIYENLGTAARMMGNQTFISKNYWQIVENYNQIFLSQNKGQFVQNFRDLGLKLLLLAKKLPDEKQSLLNAPQDRLNEKFQVIDKRGLTLEESMSEIEKLKPDIFEIGNKILQIEPLEMRMDEDQEKTVNVIEDLTVMPATNGAAPMEFEIFKEEEDLIQRQLSRPEDRKFILEDLKIGADLPPLHGQTIHFGLIQYLQGAKRQSYIEDNRDLWEKWVQRYYDYEIYRETRILQFTKESIQLRAKPKIIGYLDDAIYEGCNVVIFPESSMPESYLPKLQQFADRFEFYIIAGVETMASKGKYFNRAYVISPFSSPEFYQQKNTAKFLAPSEKTMNPWQENIETNSPPNLKVFTTPFGKFIILIGTDINQMQQYLPFIVRERHLDFVLFLNNGYDSETLNTNYQVVADEIRKPIFYVNTGQFGGTNVFMPDQPQESPLESEYSEGLLNWAYNVPEKK